MSTETETPTAPNIPADVELPSIKRNEVSKQLSKAVFSPKSPDYKGMTFFTPLLDIPKVDYAEFDGKKERVLRNVDDYIWVGLDQVSGAVNKILRGVFGVITIENIKANNGVFNLEDFIEDAADFTAARQSLANINDELDDLQALQMSYAFDKDFIDPFNEDQTPKPRFLELQKLIQEVNRRVKPLREKRDAIEREYQARAALRKQREDEKKAAAGKV